VYAAHGAAAARPVGSDRGAPGPTGGFIAHAFIGENENPLLKIRDFDATVRASMGRRVDVAMMKFCYVDIRVGTDIDALFATYRDTMAALERDFPDVAFVKATVPLTTEPAFLAGLKARLGGGGRFGPAENVARERLNTLIRHEYAGDHLFDLAAIESTAPDGTRVSGRHGGQQYFALHPGYSADLGHLAAAGSRRAATAWLKVVAQASSK
jgi:hypothetical protein